MLNPIRKAGKRMALSSMQKPVKSSTLRKLDTSMMKSSAQKTMNMMTGGKMGKFMTRKSMGR